MKQIAILLMKLYKYLVSPVLYQLFGSGCRFTPTCSEYAIDSVKKYGVLKGGKLFIRRLSRCHPFYSNDIIYDPVP
jgi:putative membrane protein insertion efficiency factor